MEQLTNLEIIQIYTKDGHLMALTSYQDISKIGIDVNNGYATLEIPINLRDIQLSIRGNRLVNQSVNQYLDANTIK